MIEEAESIVKWAMEIADELPDKYQQAAFAELLRYALKSVPGSEDADTETPARTRYSRSGSTWQERLVNEIPADHLITKGTRDQQTIWAVTRLWEQNNEATTESVRATIRTRLGETPQSTPNTSKSLRQLTPKYLERRRREEGQGYAYIPTAEALEAFAGIEERLEE